MPVGAVGAAADRFAAGADIDRDGRGRARHILGRFGIEIAKAQRRDLEMARLQRHDRLLKCLGPFRTNAVGGSKSRDGLIRFPIGRVGKQAG